MITAPQGIPQAAVDTAELLICAHLGLETLEVQRHRETVTLRGKALALSRPASRLLEVTRGDVDLTDHARLASPYGVLLDFTSLPVWPSVAVSELAPPSTVDVAYDSGWTAQTLPHAIKQAALLTAQAAGSLGGVSLPEGVTSVRLPEITVQFAGAGHQGGALPSMAAQLLRPWRRLTW